MRWDYEELRKLCQKRGVRCSIAYQNALQWKLWRADYHAERAQAVWSELDQLVEVKGPIVVGGQDWSETEFASTAETEAAAQALHSMADILAQIINEAVLKRPLSGAQVTLFNVCKNLKNQKNASSVASRIEALQASKEFDYLHAFVNTIKHRRLLDTEWRAEYGEGARDERGIRFKAFTYKGKSYSTIWASDILNDYKNKVVDLICAVGNAVNDYLRQSE